MSGITVIYDHENRHGGSWRAERNIEGRSRYCGTDTRLRLDTMHDVTFEGLSFTLLGCSRSCDCRVPVTVYLTRSRVRQMPAERRAELVRWLASQRLVRKHHGKIVPY